MIITKSLLNITNPEQQLLVYHSFFAKIEKDIPQKLNHIITIEFDNDAAIDFVHPLFLIYLLNFYELLQTKKQYQDRDIRIIFNIENLAPKVQKYIHTYLTQYIDCGIVLVVDRTFQDRNKAPSLFTDKKILLYTTEKENNLILLQKQKYNFLPIVKIANNTFNENFQDKDYWITNKKTRKKEKISSFEKRKIFYKSLQIETLEEAAYRNKSDAVWSDIFEIYLELTHNGAYITKKFKDIFREIVENIQKHTKINNISANGYISFYINRAKNKYELIVSDDYQYGFLDKYFKTVQEEFAKEEQGSIAWKDYKKIIDDFEDENYIKVLEDIFNLHYVLSAQKERIIKHFGMPLLLKIVYQLEKLSLNQYDTDELVSLNIYLNINEFSFVVKYKNGKAKVIPLENGSIRGTYFHLSFPKGLYLEDPTILTQKPLKLTTKHYKSFLQDKKNLLKNHLDKFQYYFKLNVDTLEKGKNAIVVDYSTIRETSNFLRELYSFAFLHDPQDIVVVNYPIEENEEYLQLLASTTKLTKVCNIAFLNKQYPQVFFIGGKTYEEMCIINTMLSQTYNYNKRNFLDYSKGKVKLTSHLFYKNERDEQKFFPFELFLPHPHKEDELLYTLMLDNFLELPENFEIIHLDLSEAYHINKFYYLKHVFENSQWVKLLAFDLAQKLKDKYINFDKIFFVGIEKYASFFIAEIEYLLEEKLTSYVVDDLYNDTIIRQFQDFAKLHSDKRFIFIRPSVFESNIDKLKKYINNSEQYTLIQLTKNENKTQEWIANFSKNLEDILENLPTCTSCFGGSSHLYTPLYQIDNDKYNIKNLYHTHDDYQKNSKIFEVSWRNVVYFPHIKRNTNHYLYYTRTTQFFKNNKEDIVKYFGEKITFQQDTKIPVIFTSAHNTNGDFVVLINEIVFENNAIIHSFSLDNKEQGYFSIKNLVLLYEGKEKYYSFYFVDDAISSGESFKYIYTILSSFFKDKFKALFTLIDRTNEQDKHLFKAYSEEFYTYVKMNIHPIKTGFEACYLCEREKTFKDIATKTSLVTITHTFQQKAKELASKKADEIEYEPLNIITDLKSYLRMSSTEYIYQYLDDFKVLENINLRLQNFYNEIVKPYFKNYYLNGEEIIPEIEKFLKVESKIAFLKSLAFPKVYFFKDIRENINKYIYYEIREFTNINKDNIKIIPLITSNDYEKLKNIKALDELIAYYEGKKRTNMNYFSFLLSVGSYLGINHILSYELIMYYYKLTLEIKKDENYDYKNLLDMYPIAVKQLTTYSKEQSLFFEEELKKFYDDVPFQYTRVFSRIFGLFVENTTHLPLESKIFDTIEKDGTIDEQIVKFTKILKEKILPQNIKITIQRICIDIKENSNNPFLVDIVNDYKKVGSDTNEYKLYQGASIKKEIDYDTKIEIEVKEEKYNIWCNFYSSFKTYIRITKKDEKLTPLGVISIKHMNTDAKEHTQFIEHLQISKVVLAYQNIICKFFKDYNLISGINIKYDEIIAKIQEKKQLQIEQDEKDKAYKKLLKNMENVSHTYGKYIKVDEHVLKLRESGMNDEDILDKVIDFAGGLKYIFALGAMQLPTTMPPKINIATRFDPTRSNIRSIKNFLNVVPLFIYPKNIEPIDCSNRENIKYTLEIDNSSECEMCILVSNSDIYYIVFEILFNAIMQNLDQSVKFKIFFEKNAFYIANDGKEIEVDRCKKIFDDGVTHSEKGLGIGLPKIKKYLNKCNIDISVCENKPHCLSSYNVVFTFSNKDA